MRAEGRSPIIALLAIVQSFDPALVPMATICLLLMAAGLGTASGSVFAPADRVTPQPQVGSVTGIVGAMGSLGGFVPPLVMGAVYSAKSSYSIGFMLLSDLALAGCVPRRQPAHPPRTTTTPSET